MNFLFTSPFYIGLTYQLALYYCYGFSSKKKSSIRRPPPNTALTFSSLPGFRFTVVLKQSNSHDLVADLLLFRTLICFLSSPLSTIDPFSASHSGMLSNCSCLFAAFVCLCIKSTCFYNWMFRRCNPLDVFSCDAFFFLSCLMNSNHWIEELLFTLYDICSMCLNLV